MESNKREYSRFAFSEPVEYGQAGVIVNGSIAGNISLAGMSLKIQGFIPVGTLLELKVSLGASSKLIWVKGHVVRVRKVLSDDCYEIGLKFVRDEMCARAIGEYIKINRFGPLSSRPQDGGQRS